MNFRKGELELLSTPEKYCRVMIYGTLSTGCIVALIAALAIPDKWDTFEAQIAALYLVLLIGSNKAFNAKRIFGRQILGAFAMFTGTGLLPATIIHVALAQIEPGQATHVDNLVGLGLTTALAAFIPASFSYPIVGIWQTGEISRANATSKATPSWVPRLK